MTLSSLYLKHVLTVKITATTSQHANPNANWQQTQHAT